MKRISPYLISQQKPKFCHIEIGWVIKLLPCFPCMKSELAVQKFQINDENRVYSILELHKNKHHSNEKFQSDKFCRNFSRLWVHYNYGTTKKLSNLAELNDSKNSIDKRAIYFHFFVSTREIFCANSFFSLIDHAKKTA